MVRPSRKSRASTEQRGRNAVRAHPQGRSAHGYIQQIASLVGKAGLSAFDVHACRNHASASDRQLLRESGERDRAASSHLHTQLLAVGGPRARPVQPLQHERADPDARGAARARRPAQPGRQQRQQMLPDAPVPAEHLRQHSRVRLLARSQLPR